MKKIILAVCFSVLLTVMFLHCPVQAEESAAEDNGIVVQPEDKTAIAGTAIDFSVETNLSDATYQWQYSKDGGETWKDSPSSGNTTNTVHVNTNASMDGRLYRCVIKSGSVEVETNHVLLTVKGIKTQPTEQTVIVKEKAVFTVETTVPGATFQWQYSKDGGKTWKNAPSSGATTEEVTVQTSIKLIGRLYRCVVTYDDTELYSEEVRLYIQGFRNRPGEKHILQAGQGQS